jgi:sugar phosphate isomerase/epimerase
MKLGLGSFTYTWAVGVPGHPPTEPLTPRALVRRAASLGVRVVQFADNLPLIRLPPAELEALIDCARENLISVELGTRGIREGGDLLGYLDLARRLHSPFVRVVLDSPGHEPSPAETVACLRPVVERYHDAGVKLAIENHDRFRATTLAGIILELGSDRTGVCLDTVNSFGALEGPEVVVNTLAPYTLNLHVKDFTINRVPSQMGFQVSGCAAGAGRLDVPWLLGRLRLAGADPNAILELWTPHSGDLEETLRCEANWAVQSIRFLRQFIPD